MLKFLAILAILAEMTSCTHVRSATAAYEVAPDDNPIEEGVEWVVEEGVEALTGQDIHLDLTGDTPENCSKKN